MGKIDYNLLSSDDKKEVENWISEQYKLYFSEPDEAKDFRYVHLNRLQEFVSLFDASDKLIKEGFYNDLHNSSTTEVLMAREENKRKYYDGTRTKVTQVKTQEIPDKFIKMAGGSVPSVPPTLPTSSLPSVAPISSPPPVLTPESSAPTSSILPLSASTSIKIKFDSNVEPESSMDEKEIIKSIKGIKDIEDDSIMDIILNTLVQKNKKIFEILIDKLDYLGANFYDSYEIKNNLDTLKDDIIGSLAKLNYNDKKIDTIISILKNRKMIERWNEVINDFK